MCWMVENKYDTIFSTLLSKHASKSCWGKVRCVASHFNTTVMLEPVGNVEVAVYRLDASQRLYLYFDIQYLPPLLITSWTDLSVSCNAAFTLSLSLLSPGAAIILLWLHLALHPPLHPLALPSQRPGLSECQSGLPTAAITIPPSNSPFHFLTCWSWE